MNTTDKLKRLFEAAMLEPEPGPEATRMVSLPRNPDGSESGAAGDENPDDFDPRREMLARLNRMNEILLKD